MLGVTQHWVCRNNPETRDDIVELVGVGVSEHAPVGIAGYVDAVEMSINDVRKQFWTPIPIFLQACCASRMLVKGSHLFSSSWGKVPSSGR